MTTELIPVGFGPYDSADITGPFALFIKPASGDIPTGSAVFLLQKKNSGGNYNTIERLNAANVRIKGKVRDTGTFRVEQQPFGIPAGMDWDVLTGGSGGFIASLTGTTGAWFKPQDQTTLYADSARTTLVPQTIGAASGTSIGSATDKQNGNHAIQATGTKQPKIPAAGYMLRSDFVDDQLDFPCTISNGEMWINTPYGHTYSEIHANTTCNLPLNDAKEIIVTDHVTTLSERAAISAYFGTTKRYGIFLKGSTSFVNITVYTGGTNNNVYFTGANGATVTKTINTSALFSWDVSADGLTAPVAMAFDDALSTNTALTLFYCYSNQLTGSIPSLSTNTALTTFYCYSNQLTGSIPSLSTNTALASFYCYSNQLTGSIPSSSTNTALTLFYCYYNQLTGYAGGGASISLGYLHAFGNLLPVASCDLILSDLVTANRTTGTRVVNVGGTGNAALDAPGLASRSTLVSRGWTVTNN